MSDYDNLIDMLLVNAREVAVADRVTIKDEKARQYALRNIPMSGIVKAIGTAKMMSLMAQTSTPYSISDILDQIGGPRHELVVYLKDRNKVNIQLEYPEYFCGADVIKSHVLDGLVAFSANDKGCPYIWEVVSDNEVTIANKDELSRFDIIEVVDDAILVDKKYRVVVIEFRQPTFDVELTDIDEAVKVFVRHLYITDGLEDSL